ncbi:hypothetical protein AAC387_Pa04g1152 [Persea americana]
MEVTYNVPVGFRFCPTDEELIKYLWIKNNGLVLPSNAITEYNVYACNPDQLPRDFNHGLRNELYFFTTRVRKNSAGRQPPRTAGDGFWKSTSVLKVIHGSGKEYIGYKKTLVFYYKENKKKSDWIMHEFSIDKTDDSKLKESSKVGGFALCRIYQFAPKPISSSQIGGNVME